MLSQSGFEPAYKIAYMTRDILPSDETIRKANADANNLAAAAKDVKSFDDYVAKKNNATPDKGAVFLSSGETPLERNVDRLKQGNLDVVIEDQYVFHYFMKTHHAQFRNAGALGREKVYIALSPSLPESPAVARALDEGLRDLRASGELEKILTFYGIQDWESKDR